jgi:hypothetical protein
LTGDIIFFVEIGSPTASMLEYTPKTDPQYGIHPMVQNCLMG